MDGFWIDRVDPREKEIPDGKRVTGTLMRCEAWLNGALGIGLVTGNGHLHVIDAKVASNGEGGIGYIKNLADRWWSCLLYTSPSPRDQRGSRMPSSA